MAIRWKHKAVLLVFPHFRIRNTSSRAGFALGNISPLCDQLHRRRQQHFSIQQPLQATVHLNHKLCISYHEPITWNCHAVENCQHRAGLNLLAGFKQRVWRSRWKAIPADRAHLPAGGPMFGHWAVVHAESESWVFLPGLTVTAS